MKETKPIKIDPKLELLYKSLIELDIKYYLCSNKFLDFCKKAGCGGAWQIYINDIENFYNISVSTRLERAEYAFRLLLDGFFRLNDRSEFLNLLGNLVNDFRANLTLEKDFSDLRKNLLNLGYKEDEISWIFENHK